MGEAAEGIGTALVLAQASGAGAAGYALDMLRALLALAGVCLLAWVSLRLLARGTLRGPWAARRDRTVEVLERVPLEGRRSLYVVRAQDKLLLLGTGESGPPALITELDPGLDPLTAEESGPAPLTTATASSGEADG